MGRPRTRPLKPDAADPLANSYSAELRLPPGSEPAIWSWYTQDHPSAHALAALAMAHKVGQDAPVGSVLRVWHDESMSYNDGAEQTRWVKAAHGWHQEK